MNLGYSIPLYF